MITMKVEVIESLDKPRVYLHSEQTIVTLEDLAPKCPNFYFLVENVFLGVQSPKHTVAYLLIELDYGMERMVGLGLG